MDTYITPNKILLDSSVYLEACQHKRISLKTLGLKELSYEHVHNKKKSKILHAVIPENEQYTFINRACLENEDTNIEIPTSSNMKKRTKSYLLPKTTIDPNKSFPWDIKNENKSPITNIRMSSNGLPLYASTLNRVKELMKKEREDAILLNKRLDHLKKVSVSYDMIDKDGIKYVYDLDGIKISEQNYHKHKEELERIRAILPPKPEGPYFEGLILDKTAQFVELKRQEAEEIRIQEILRYQCKWRPGHLPSSTLLLEDPTTTSSNNEPINYGNNIRTNPNINTTTTTSLSKDQNHSFTHLNVLPMHLVKQWPEYQIIECGDVLLTIEHCCNCWQHHKNTHHVEKKYIETAEYIRDSLTEVVKQYAVRFYSLLKPITDSRNSSNINQTQFDNTKKAKNSLSPKAINTFEVDYTKRCGAFEVQVALKSKHSKQLISHLLFSKLFKGVWPKVSELKRLLVRLLDQAQFIKIEESFEDYDNDVVVNYGNKKKNKKKKKNTNNRYATITTNEKLSVTLGDPDFDLRIQPEEFMELIDNTAQMTIQDTVIINNHQNIYLSENSNTNLLPSLTNTTSNNNNINNNTSIINNNISSLPQLVTNITTSSFSTIIETQQLPEAMGYKPSQPHNLTTTISNNDNNNNNNTCNNQNNDIISHNSIITHSNHTNAHTTSKQLPSSSLPQQQHQQYRLTPNDLRKASTSIVALQEMMKLESDDDDDNNDNINISHNINDDYNRNNQKRSNDGITDLFTIDDYQLSDDDT